MYEDQNKLNYVRIGLRYINVPKIFNKNELSCEKSPGFNHYSSLSRILCNTSMLKSSLANPSVLDVSLYMVMKRQIIWQCSPSERCKADSSLGWVTTAERSESRRARGGGWGLGRAGGGPSLPALQVPSHE